MAVPPSDVVGLKRKGPASAEAMTKESDRVSDDVEANPPHSIIRDCNFTNVY